MIKIEVHGINDIHKNLKKLQGNKARNIMRAGARASATIYKKGAQDNLPSKHKNKIGVVSKRTYSSNIRHVFWAGIIDTYWQLVFLEFGAKSHEITTRTKKILSDSNKIIGKKVQHPGIRKLAFMRRSFENKSQASLDAFWNRIWLRIKKEFK